jgi:U3 small nucleolar RNA-associated protein 12
VHSNSFGIVASGTANIVWTSNQREGSSSGQVYVAAKEEVLCWDIKKGEILSRWKDEKCTHAVTSIAQSKADPEVFAVGYDDGSIRLWDSKIATTIVSFNGHRSAVTVLAFDKAGVRLASGSKDTDIIIWDLLAEVGLYKLRGHKDQVTGLRFVEPIQALQDEEEDRSMAIEPVGEDGGFLVTTGKDSLIKLWDLSSRHCIETHVAQSNGECWALGVAADVSLCITAGTGGEMKVWGIDTDGLLSTARLVDKPESTRYLSDRGVLMRKTQTRATEVVFHPRKDYFAVHGADKSVEIWRVRSEAEIKKSLARKRRRRREKEAAAKGKEGKEVQEDGDEPVDLATATVADMFGHSVTIRTGGRVRSVAWALNRGQKDLQLALSMSNNLVELYNIPPKERSKSKEEGLPEYTRSLSIELPGHRTDIRSLALSSDDRMLASAADGSLKIWNVRTSTCIRTFECGYAVCCSFLPGDKVVVVGTKSGELQLFDVASASLLDSVEAHQGAIWSLHVHPDGRSVVSGSEDKTARFWNFRVVQEEILGTKRTTPRLKLVPSRVLKVDDEILSLRFSPDGRLLAVALLNFSVKVFFADSLKRYLDLYGHKRPVLSMDISYDSKLLVTCASDKNVRIWGLDFGDCHRSLFGHQDTVSQVVFVPHNSEGNGHHFFSCSKDRTIKYWDGDKFQQIQRLNGHHGEVTSIAIARSGSFLVSAGLDKSITVWEETEEQIFLEEEREREMEELYETTLVASLEKEPESEEQRTETADAGKQTIETLMAGERIAEALETGITDLNLLKEYDEQKSVDPSTPPPQRNIVYLALGNISAEEHVLSVLQKVKAAALNDALMTLPFSMVPTLFIFLDIFAQRGMNIPLTCRVLLFMLKTHHKSVVSSKTMKVMLDGVRLHLREALKRERDEMGFNIAALTVADMQIGEQSVKEYVDETWDEKAQEDEEGVKKRKFITVA